MGLVIDTSAVVELERSGSEWADALSAGLDEGVALPAIVHAELLAGVHLADTAERASERRAMIDALVGRRDEATFRRVPGLRVATLG